MAVQLRRPFYVRPYTMRELRKWFGSPVADREQPPAKRVIKYVLEWDADWDRWARFALSTGALVAPRRRIGGSIWQAA